jgi:hypothetical protein
MLTASVSDWHSDSKCYWPKVGLPLSRISAWFPAKHHGTYMGHFYREEPVMVKFSAFVTVFTGSLPWTIWWAAIICSIPSNINFILIFYPCLGSKHNASPTLQPPTYRRPTATDTRTWRTVRNRVSMETNIACRDTVSVLIPSFGDFHFCRKFNTKYSVLQ